MNTRTAFSCRCEPHCHRLDFIPHYGATLGNVGTYLNAGAEFRVGYTLAR